MEVLENQLDDFIEKEYKKLDIDSIIEDPEGALREFTDKVRDEIERKYSVEAMALGFAFSDQVKESIKKGNKIEVEDSDDPNLNEGEIVNKDEL